MGFVTAFFMIEARSSGFSASAFAAALAACFSASFSSMERAIASASISTADLGFSGSGSAVGVISAAGSGFLALLLPKGRGMSILNSLRFSSAIGSGTSALGQGLATACFAGFFSIFFCAPGGGTKS